MPVKGVVCYICGREFGLSSIAIHEPQCLKKWEVENSKLPRNQKRPLPIKPEMLPNIGPGSGEIDRARRNQMAEESARGQLLPCENCGRTFQPDRLPVHMKSCKKPVGGPPPRVTRQGTFTKESNEAQSTPKRNSPKPNSGPVKPVSVVCYICGREFGTKSIEIHEPQCLKKWEVENNKLPKGSRRPLPKRPDFSKMSLDEMNDAAWEASKASLVQCKNCGRRFATDRLSVHMKSCREPNGKFTAPEVDKPSSKGKPPQGPVYIICFICGRKYGSKSIDIHEPQCLEKWKIENSNLPPKLRRPTPVRPDRSQMVLTGGGVDMDAMNDAAWEASKLQLIECENCGRRFQPDRLPVHQRSCRPGNTSKRVPASSDKGSIDGDYNQMARKNSTGSKAQQNSSKPISNPSGSSIDTIQLGAGPVINEFEDVGGLYPCKKCGRKFASDRLQVHLNVCVGEKKRKVFDMKKMRVQGTEAESFVNKKNKPTKEPPKKNNWRAKHEEFIAAIKYAKISDKVVKEGGDLKSLPPPPVSSNPDYIQCPHCGRKFNTTAGERHIPKCKDTINKPKPPPRLRR